MCSSGRHSEALAFVTPMTRTRRSWSSFLVAETTSTRVSSRSRSTTTTTTATTCRFLSSSKEDSTVATITTIVDYLVTDSNDLVDAERPNLFTDMIFVDPREAVPVMLLVVGAGISLCNVVGSYDETYLHLEMASVGLGFLCAMLSVWQVVTKYNLSPHKRRGLVNDDAVTLYAGLYSGTVTWLAWRTSEFGPRALADGDGLWATLAIGVLILSAVAPALTLVPPTVWTRSNRLVGTMRLSPEFPALSPTELLRARGLLALGVLGSIFAPDCVAFLLGGSDWWDRITELHPAQQTLESSTSLFALFATEASMISHRAGKIGVAPYRVIVPTFAVICFALAVLPCIAALYWIGDDVSFFSFYRE